MTLKDFLKAWSKCDKMQKNSVLKQDKECENFLCENYGLKKGEFDEIILELKDSNALKWWNEMLFDYFLEKTEKAIRSPLPSKRNLGLMSWILSS